MLLKALSSRSPFSHLSCWQNTFWTRIQLRGFLLWFFSALLTKKFTLEIDKPCQERSETIRMGLTYLHTFYNFSVQKQDWDLHRSKLSKEQKKMMHDIAKNIWLASGKKQKFEMQIYIRVQACISVLESFIVAFFCSKKFFWKKVWMSGCPQAYLRNSF